MKKLLYLLVFIFAINTTAQSTLLRLNYKKGDKYVVTIKQDITTPQMMMNMTLTSSMKVTNSEGSTYNSETKFTRIVADVFVGANSMSYDSSKKDDELDQAGLMLKSQMSPMLAAVISMKGTNLGEVLEAKTSVKFQGSENLGESNVIYPKKAVKVGDTFKMDKTMNGITVNMVYTVSSITNKEVLLKVDGNASGDGEAKIKGTMNIDKASGIVLKSKIETKATVMGQEVTTIANTTMKKVS